MVITQSFAHPLAHSIRQPNLALDRSVPTPDIFLRRNSSIENPMIGSCNSHPYMSPFNLRPPRTQDTWLLARLMGASTDPYNN